MGSNINIKTIKVTPRHVILGLLAVLGLVALFFVVTQLQKVWHPAYPVVQGLIYEFEKTTGGKVTYDHLGLKDGNIVLDNVYTDVQNKNVKNKTVLYAEKIAVARDLSTIITNLSLSRPTPDGLLTVGLRDVRLSRLRIEQGQFRGGRLEVASLFLAGEAAPAQMEALKGALRTSLGIQKDDIALVMINKLAQMGVAVDVTLKTPSTDQWLYIDRWYMANVSDLSNRALLRGLTEAVQAWRRGVDPVSPQPFVLTDFIKADGLATVFKDLGGIKLWLSHFAKDARLSEAEAVPLIKERLGILEGSFIKANPDFQSQARAFFQALQNLVTGKSHALSVSFEPDPEAPNAGKVFKVLP
jgi:hypothetical protein